MTTVRNEDDWYTNQRLRVELIEDNPFIQIDLTSLRAQLGIPEHGFGVKSERETGEWLLNHFKAQPPWKKWPAVPDASMKGQLELERWDGARYLSEAKVHLAYGNLDTLSMWQFLPLTKESRWLCANYSLSNGFVGPVAWYVLTGSPPSSSRIKLVTTEEVSREPVEILSDSDRVLSEGFWRGVPRDLPGTLVIIKVLVNEHTTQSDFLDVGWEAIKRAQEQWGRRQNRRPNVKDYQEWLKAYLAHRAEDMSLSKVCNEFKIDLDTLKYRVRVLDELFIRSKNNTP